jgi:hypothetical protein
MSITGQFVPTGFESPHYMRMHGDFDVREDRTMLRPTTTHQIVENVIASNELQRCHTCMAGTRTEGGRDTYESYGWFFEPMAVRADEWWQRGDFRFDSFHTRQWEMARIKTDGGWSSEWGMMPREMWVPQCGS